MHDLLVATPKNSASPLVLTSAFSSLQKNFRERTVSDLGRETIASIFAHQSPTKGGRALSGAEEVEDPNLRVTQNPLRRQSVSSIDGAAYEYADPAGESEDV